MPDFMVLMYQVQDFLVLEWQPALYTHTHTHTHTRTHTHTHTYMYIAS